MAFDDKTMIDVRTLPETLEETREGDAVVEIVKVRTVTGRVRLLDFEKDPAKADDG